MFRSEIDANNRKAVKHFVLILVVVDVPFGDSWTMVTLMRILMS